MGLEVRNNSLIPRMTDNESYFQGSYEKVRFSCKERYNKNCSCWKADLNYTSLCKECHDLFVIIQEKLTNVVATIVILETLTLGIFQMHFSKITKSSLFLRECCKIRVI